MYQIDFNHPSSIYFVGIGGISMSGLAEILNDAGFHVSGSDRSHSALTDMLEQKGITVFYGQRSENITDDIDCVVFTSAISKDNPEYVATMEKGIPYLTRAQLLGELMQNYKNMLRQKIRNIYSKRVEKDQRLHYIWQEKPYKIVFN